MTNPANIGNLIGRLAQDIKEFPNSDGSKKQLITIAVDDNFKSGADKTAQTNFVQVENFVRAGGNAGGWDRVHKGDLVALQFRVDAKPYTKNGVTEYPTKLVVEGFPTFLEPKSVTEKRAAEHAVKQAQQNGALPAGEVSSDERIAALEAELAQARTAEPATVAVAGTDYESTAPFGE